MQRALLIDEIIRHILRCSSEDGHNTLNALARTCRTWESPALDYLWIRLSSVVPLLLLIPSVQLVNGIYALENSDSLPDLTRFHLYARRVRYIAHRQNVKVHPSILSIHTSENGALSPVSLLPSLLSANLSIPNCDRIHACMSLSSELSNLDLDLGFKPNSSSDYICQYLQEVIRIAPGLRRLNIRGSVAHSLLGLVSSMRNLQALSLRLGASMTITALVAVSTFPNLSSLELHAGHLDADDLFGTLRNQDRPLFPSLKTLRMRAHAPVLESVLDSIPLDTLHTLRIEAEDPSGTPVAWSGVFKAISHKAANTLQNLTIEHHIELDGVELGSADASGSSPVDAKMDTPILFNDLQILRRLRHLRQMVIDTTLPPTLSDGNIITLVTAWPELQHLDLNATLPSLGATSPTFMSLNALAKGAPNLESLVMSADLGGIESATVPVDIPSQLALTRLTLACTPTSAPMQVAQYLHRLFPSLVEVEGHPEREEEWRGIQDAVQRMRLSPWPNI